jgi:hypothetical protein
MSYDLMVFEPEVAPKDHSGFMAWCSEQTSWSEDRSYNDPTITSVRLQAWFSEMVRSFPPLNGPLAEEELPEDEATAADYAIGEKTIYIAFAWSKAEVAYQTTLSIAAKHNLGFFNVNSTDEEVWLPTAGRLILAHQRRATGLFKNVGKLFRKG